VNGMDQKIIKIAEKFGGEVTMPSKTIKLDKPVKIKSRADALDAFYLLLHGIDYDWTCDEHELLRALKRLFKKLLSKGKTA